MKSLMDIKSTLEKHKHKLFNTYPIKSMAIFGSYSRSDQNENSDIDILVDRRTDHSPTLAKVKFRQVTASTHKANLQRRSRDDHRDASFR